MEITTALSRAELDILGQVVLGTPPSVIAVDHKVSITTIQRLISSDRFQHYKRELERKALESRNLSIAEKVQDGFVEASPAAVTTITKLAEEGTRQELRFEASKEVLDRAGFQVVKKEERKHVIVNISDESLAALIRAIQGSNTVNAEEGEILEYVGDGRKDHSPTAHGTPRSSEARPVGVSQPNT